jgi:hypothetical protein
MQNKVKNHVVDLKFVSNGIGVDLSDIQIICDFINKEF